MENKFIQMVVNIKDNLKMVKKMAKGHINGLMEVIIQDNLKMDIWKVKEYKYFQIMRLIKEFL